MALEGLEYGNHMTIRDWRALKAFGPPLLKRIINSHKEGALRGWGFSKCIAHVITNTFEVQCSREGPGQSVNRLFYTGCIGFSQCNCLSVSFAAIACASGFRLINACEWVFFL